MTPQVTALVEFVDEFLLRRDALYAQAVALQKELGQLQRAKKRARSKAK